MLASLLMLPACRRDANFDLSDFNEEVYTPAYADGYELLADGHNRILLRTLSPWQGADSAAVATLLILPEGADAPAGYDGQVLNGPANRIACMSSSYVAMLETLGAGDRVAAVSGIDFISSPTIQRNRNLIPDVGYDGNIDYEKLAAAAPDLALLYGVNGASGMEPKLKQLGIPYAYIGEYMEDNPLGKAEWLVALGAMTGKLTEAVNAFRGIPQRYDSLRRMVMHPACRPKVMLNAPYADSWIMASPHSYMAQLIADAGAEYIFSDSAATTATPVDMEQAYLMACNADYWINPGVFTDLGQMKVQLPHFSDVPPVKSGNVWNCNLHKTPGGGNDFWESGVVNPDRILSDLIRIFHPDALSDTTLVWNYFKRLE